MAVTWPLQVSQELTAWKETWFDAKLELFALEEKEKQAAEKKEATKKAAMEQAALARKARAAPAPEPEPKKGPP